MQLHERMHRALDGPVRLNLKGLFVVGVVWQVLETHISLRHVLLPEPQTFKVEAANTTLQKTHSRKSFGCGSGRGQASAV